MLEDEALAPYIAGARERVLQQLLGVRAWVGCGCGRVGLCVSGERGEFRGRTWCGALVR